MYEGAPSASCERWRERRGKQAVCWAYKRAHCYHWQARAYSLDNKRQEERGGWLPLDCGLEEAEARAEGALVEVLLALPA